MRWLSFEELEAASDEIDALAAATPEIDGFCSSTAWIVPARAAFTPQADPVILLGDHGVATLMAMSLAGGVRAAFPLEASWGLASPFLSRTPDALVDELFHALRSRPRAERRVHAIVASGLGETSTALEALARASRRPLQPAAPATDRVVASLAGGLDGFLARRSPRMRAALRRVRRAASDRGIVYERHTRFTGDEAVAAAARIFALEERSWKAAEGGGMEPGPMREFYRLMLPRLARRDALRVVFVTREGRDLAFCFGGLFPAGGEITYRGLQASYDDAFAAEAPGILAHYEMIHLCCDEAIAAYDLGTDMEYKRRWGEPGLRTVSCVAIV